APVDHHPVRRARATGLRQLRAGLRDRHGMVAAGQPGPARPTGRHLGLPAAVPPDPAARERRRRQVVAGAYPLRHTERPKVTIAAMGAIVPEALAAADRL